MNCTKDFAHRHNNWFGWLLAGALMAFLFGAVTNEPHSEQGGYHTEGEGE